MKHLTLIRHAKSSWKEEELSDFDRPLNKRGKNDLPLLCERLLQAKITPDFLLYSSSLRTTLTAEMIIKRLNLPQAICHPCADIYESSPATLLHVIQQTPAEAEHLMLVGHNPGLQELGKLLLGQSLPHFPTSAVLHLTCPVESWQELEEQRARLVWFDYPKLHLR